MKQKVWRNQSSPCWRFLLHNRQYLHQRRGEFVYLLICCVIFFLCNLYQELVFMWGNAQVVNMERDVLKFLNFEIGNPTAKTFLRWELFWDDGICFLPVIGLLLMLLSDTHTHISFYLFWTNRNFLGELAESSLGPLKRIPR